MRRVACRPATTTAATSRQQTHQADASRRGEVVGGAERQLPHADALQQPAATATMLAAAGGGGLLLQQGGQELIEQAIAAAGDERVESQRLPQRVVDKRCHIARLVRRPHSYVQLLVL